MKNKRSCLSSFAAGCFIFSLCCASLPQQAAASPWAEKEGYGAKTGGKFVFGLKHTLFSWMNPWAEAHDPVYETRWTGFCAGIGKSVIYTAAGAIQLVTFPIPVDFPNVGLGMHIPANHQGEDSSGKKLKRASQPAGTPAAEAGSEISSAPLPQELPVSEAAEAKKVEAPAAAVPASPESAPKKEIPAALPAQDETSTGDPELDAAVKDTEKLLKTNPIK